MSICQGGGNHRRTRRKTQKLSSVLRGRQVTSGSKKTFFFPLGGKGCRTLWLAKKKKHSSEPIGHLLMLMLRGIPARESAKKKFHATSQKRGPQRLSSAASCKQPPPCPLHPLWQRRHPARLHLTHTCLHLGWKEGAMLLARKKK